MAEKDVGALVVMDGGRLAGIISERDYARKVILHGKSSQDIAGARDHDRRRWSRCSPSQTVEECMALDDQQAHPPPARGRGRAS